MVGRVGLFLHAITVLLGVVGAISANGLRLRRLPVRRSRIGAAVDIQFLLQTTCN